MRLHCGFVSKGPFPPRSGFVQPGAQPRSLRSLDAAPISGAAPVRSTLGHKLMFLLRSEGQFIYLRVTEVDLGTQPMVAFPSLRLAQLFSDAWRIPRHPDLYVGLLPGVIPRRQDIALFTTDGVIEEYLRATQLFPCVSLIYRGAGGWIGIAPRFLLPLFRRRPQPGAAADAPPKGVAPLS